MVPRNSSLKGLDQSGSDAYLGLASSRRLGSILSVDDPYGATENNYATERSPLEADATRRWRQLASLP